MKHHALLSIPLLIFSLLFFSAVAHAQEEDSVPRLEIGAQFSSLSVNAPDIFRTETHPGIGGRITYNLTRHFAVEAEGNFHPERGFQTLTVGGSAVQGQFGVKAGRRFERFGLFAKARPGFVTHSGVAALTSTTTQIFDGITYVFPVFERQRKTYFSTDIGGVLEFYPSRRLVTRFDFGDTIIRYGEHRAPLFVTNDPSAQTVIVVNRPAETRHSFQFTAGIGFRF